MARQHQNEDRTFSVAFDAKMEAIQAAGTQRRKLMRDAWEDIDNGWRALEQRLVGVGIVKSSEQGMLRLNADGSHVNVCQSVLRGEGPPESRTLASLFEKAWDKRLPRDEDGFIVLDESPTCMKRILHALLAASGTGSGTANIELLGDSLPPDEMAYLPYMFSALGLPALRSTVLEPHEFGELSATVLGWCPGKPSGLELIYRASRDGRTPQAFHSQCGDDSPSTVTLFRVSNNTGPGSHQSVVGGFSSVPWTPVEGSWGWRSSPGAFVFMLKDGTSTGSAEFKAVKWGMKEEADANTAVWRHAKYGPYFGGYDLSSNQKKWTLKTGSRSYSIPAGSPFLALDGHDVVEIETFRVSSAKATPRKLDTNLGLIDVPKVDVTTIFEGGREDDINTFGFSIADCLMEERIAMDQAYAELLQANAKGAASANALAVVYGPHVAVGEEQTVIELSVRGTRMTTLRSTLQACPGSALAARFDEDKWPATDKDVDERGRRVIDCNPSVFSKVLDVLRMKKRMTWDVSSAEWDARVAIKAADRAEFDEFVDMYFPGCESFIMDCVVVAGFWTEFAGARSCSRKRLDCF